MRIRPCFFVVVAAALAGCTPGPDWPAAPTAVYGPPEAPTAVLWAPDGPDAPQYLQSCREGVKRLLLRQSGPGQFTQLADLDAHDPRNIRHVFLFLDGVPYALFAELYSEGHFRLFHRPARMVAPFPSLTDISFGNVFGIPGASCYESVVFDRAANRLHSGTRLYLSGLNEQWSAKLDYRQPLWVDGVSYVVPTRATRRELRSMFDTAHTTLRERPRQTNVLLYSISTDAACHVVGWAKARALLLELDQYIERLVYETDGQVGVVMMADHGNNFVPRCVRVDIEAAVRAAGLKPVHDRGFKRPAEVIVPRFGLISLVRAYCQNETDRQTLIDALAATRGVEHVMWRQDGRVRIRGANGEATIDRRTAPAGEESVEYFSYAPREGDPLELLGLLAKLPARRFEGGPADYYAAADLLDATAEHIWPDPLWRIWHGLNDQAAVVPDVVASLGPGWYYGAPGLDRFADLNGTHGGLRRADTNTFFTTTMFAPPPRMRTTDVQRVIGRHFDWRPPVGDPATEGLGRLLRK